MSFFFVGLVKMFVCGIFVTLFSGCATSLARLGARSDLYAKLARRMTIPPRSRHTMIATVEHGDPKSGRVGNGRVEVFVFFSFFEPWSFVFVSYMKAAVGAVQYFFFTSLPRPTYEP